MCSLIFRHFPLAPGCGGGLSAGGMFFFFFCETCVCGHWTNRSEMNFASDEWQRQSNTKETRQRRNFRHPLQGVPRLFFFCTTATFPISSFLSLSLSLPGSSILNFQGIEINTVRQRGNFQGLTTLPTAFPGSAVGRHRSRKMLDHWTKFKTKCAAATLRMRFK